jgi:hypothetical protein
MAKESRGQAASQKQLILVGVMFAVLLGVVYFMFLKGGGEEPVDSTAPAPAVETEPAEEEPTDKSDEDEAEASKKKSKGPVETSEVFAGKDPFEPVIDLTPVVAAADKGDATTDGTTPATDDGSTTAPTTPTTPVAPVTPPDDDDDDDDDDVAKTGYLVKLEKISSAGGTRTAHVQTVKRASWDKQRHKLEDGDRFRKHFKVTSIDNRCATFMFDKEWFSLCEGQRVVRK